ncbi:MAG: aromatic ring-hydroxylating dioxygenase subunit alpha [Immundisolibacteraceae bacterium]|nr:aromatic ring-hydroxylating dioxygenase subunit alpha [Immundisolibacteraceae bacterium]
MNAPDAKPFNTQFSQLGSGPLSIESMTSSEYFELEREKIFKKSWLNVGRIEDLPKPGDYMVQSIAILQSSLIIVRGDDQQIRAFHNVCRHRGNEIASGCGNAKGFSCDFHGWTYSNQGELAFVPDEGQFFNLDKNKLGLVSLQCETWKGFIFINADPDPSQSLIEYLGGLGDQLKDFPFEQMVPMHRLEAEVNANWKVIIDAFQESYHAGFVHRLTAGDMLDPDSDDPYMHLSSVRLFGPHRSASVPMNPEYVAQNRPAEMLSYQLASSLWLQEGAMEQQFTPGTNPDDHKHWLFDINVCFPNFFIDVANGWFFTYHFWPVAVDKTLWQYRFYMIPPADAGEAISREYSKLALRDLLREDLNTVEATQRGLMSGAIKEIHLSDQEVAVRHQYKVVEELVRG